MNFSSEIISVIEYIASKFGIAIDWSNQNIIPIIQDLAGKYITWEISTSIAWIMIAIILEIILVVLIRNDCKRWNSAVITVFGSIIAVALIPMIACQIFDIIRCVTFPELQIFQYLQSIVSTMK